MGNHPETAPLLGNLLYAVWNWEDSNSSADRKQQLRQLFTAMGLDAEPHCPPEKCMTSAFDVKVVILAAKQDRKLIPASSL